MTTPLPNADSLLAAMATLDTAMSQFESNLRSQRFQQQSSDGRVSVTADGLGRIVAVKLDPELVKAGNAASLAQIVIPVVNAALAAASSYAATAAATAAATWSIPGLPAIGSPPPEYAGFVSGVAKLTGVAQTEFDWLRTSESTYRFPPVTIVLRGCPSQLVKLEFDSPLEENPPYVEGGVETGINDTVDDVHSTDDLPTDVIDAIDEIETGKPKLTDFAVYATRELRIDNDVKVVSADGKAYGIVGSVGSATSLFGVASQVGTVISIPQVSLERDAKVHGDLLTTVPIKAEPSTTPPSDHVTGFIDTHADISFPPLTLGVTFPPNNKGDRKAEPNGRLDLPPDAYGAVVIERGAELRLTAGTYTMTRLTLESGSRLYVDESSGRVRVFLQLKLTFRGSVVGPNNTSKPNVYFGVAGTEPADIETAFIGTVVAPNAKIDVKTATHEGAFFGRDVEIHSNALVRPRAYVP